MSQTSPHGSPANDHTVLEPDLNYICQRCTACCKWPGDVRLDDADLVAIPAFLEISGDEFISRFTRLRSDRQGLSLLEKDNHECIMFDGESCRIHAVKPSQCAGFPNKWNFPGWQDLCKAIPVPVDGMTGR